MKLNVLKSVGTACVALGLTATLSQSARALEPQTLFNFQQTPYPVTSPLVQAPDGNFYGTTPHGGANWSGQVLRVTPAGVLTIVASDITNLASGLVLGNDGQLYGMTGRDNGTGVGTVFRLTTSGALTTIVVFNGVNAYNPLSGLVLARDGNFYGVSPGGGTNAVGSLFRVTPAGLVTLLVSFDAASRGGVPMARLTVGADGNLYGVTPVGALRQTEPFSKRPFQEHLPHCTRFNLRTVTSPELH
jgi:uncharacterized repeat protein (TIGR03803 family)